MGLNQSRREDSGRAEAETNSLAGRREKECPPPHEGGGGIATVTLKPQSKTIATGEDQKKGARFEGEKAEREPRIKTPRPSNAGGGNHNRPKI